MYLRVNLLGPGPHITKKNLPGRGLTKLRNTAVAKSVPGHVEECALACRLQH